MFRDRSDAGRRLGTRLQHALASLSPEHPGVVLGLARGGVPVAREVAARLALPLEVLVVRKVGAPGSPEFAVAAIAEDGTSVVSDVAHRAFPSDAALAAALAQQLVVAQQRARAYRAGRPLTALRGRTVILVDDGLATGLTMECAIASVRGRGAFQVVVAVPTASTDGLARMESRADRVVACEAPALFFAVGEQYEAFPQVEDAAALVP